MAVATRGAAETVAPLREQVAGDVYTSGDSGYDAARKLWNFAHEQRPAIIVVAKNAVDVSAAVRFAHKVGFGVAVQSAGHGISLAPDDALLIITSRMTAVHIDSARQTAWVEAGAKWRMVLEPAQAVELAPLLGSSPEVGVVG